MGLCYDYRRNDKGIDNIRSRADLCSRPVIGLGEILQVSFVGASSQSLVLFGLRLLWLFRVSGL